MCTQSPTAHRIESIRLAHEAVAALGPALSCAAGTVRCLHALIEEAAQEYALGQIPSPLAIESFGHVLRQIECAEGPTLNLTPSGGIWAEWSDAPRRSVAIFVGQDGRMRLGAVLTVQEACRPPLLLELEGDVDSIVDRLRTDRDLRWVRCCRESREALSPTESGA